MIGEAANTHPAFVGITETCCSVPAMPGPGWAGLDAPTVFRLQRPEKLAGNLCGNMLSRKIYGPSCSRQSQKYHHSDGSGYYRIFYTTALTFTTEGEMRTGTFTFSPPAPARSFLGVWCAGIREGESRFQLLPNLLFWVENKVRLC